MLRAEPGVEPVTPSVHRARGTSSDSAVRRATLQLYNRSAREAARRVLREFRPEVVHVHLYHGQLSPAVLTPFEDAGVARVVTAHNYRMVCPTGSRMLPDGGFCRYRVGWSCARHCSPLSLIHHGLREVWYGTSRSKFHVVIAPGSAMRESLEREVFEGVRMIHYGSTVRVSKRPVDAARNQDVLYVGRLHSTKGVQNLIQAFAPVAKRVPGATLTICGEGPQRAELERLAAALLSEGAYTFTGWLDGDAVAKLRCGAALQCVPSIWPENSPLTVYECLSAGLPLLGSRAGGIPDLATDDVEGRLVDVTDIDGFSAMLEEMLSDPAARDRYAHASLRRAEQLTMDRHLGELEHVYAAAVAKAQLARH